MEMCIPQESIQGQWILTRTQAFLTWFLLHLINHPYLYQKLDSNGHLIWAKSIGGIEYNRVQSIEYDPFGNIYVLGTFTGNVDFDPSPNSSWNVNVTGLNMFLLKLDSNGDFIRVRNWGNILSNFTPDELECDQSGNVYVTGEYSVFFDANPWVGVDTLNPRRAKRCFCHKT